MRKVATHFKTSAIALHSEWRYIWTAKTDMAIIARITLISFATYSAYVAYVLCNI